MINFNLVKMNMLRNAHRGVLLLRKFSPEVLLAVGVVGVVTSTVMACKATLKADDVLVKAKGKIDRIHNAKATADEKEYTVQDHKKDLTVVYIQTAVDFVILYSPAVTLGVASIACILGAHNIMRKRNLAIVAAYKAVEQSFSGYRKRVIEEFGVEKDRQFKRGITKKDVFVIEEDENGDEKQVIKSIDVIDPNGYSEYSRFFDESCSQWTKIPGYNMSFLIAQQNHANDMLHARGHLFLNEVYDMLGIPRTPVASQVGWVLDETDPNNDNFVDFGVFEAENERARDFVNGYERSILLDFNVGGAIYDLI